MRDFLHSRFDVRHARSRGRWCASIGLLFLLSVTSAVAQDLATHASALVAVPDSSDSTLTISKRVDEVQLVFTVTDKSGRFVDELQVDDFRLLDNDRPPERIYNFQQRSDLPLQVVLLVDISSSIEHRFAFEQKSAVTFLKKILRPGVDAAAVISFGTHVHRVQSMTRKMLDWETAIYCLSAYGETALYDAIVLASKSFSPQMTAEGVRKVMIVLSDGADTISAATESRALAAAAESDAIVLVVDASSAYSLNKGGELFLKNLTSYSGGMLLRATDNAELKRALQKMDKILRTQYSLSYKPAEFETNGSFRSIRISAQQPKLQVHSRAGYYARAR